MPQTYLPWAIAATLLCCIPTGIAAIIFATQVSSKWSTGDVAGAIAASNKAKTWVIVSVVAGLAVGVIYFFIALGSASSGSGY